MVAEIVLLPTVSISAVPPYVICSRDGSYDGLTVPPPERSIGSVEPRLLPAMFMVTFVDEPSDMVALLPSLKLLTLTTSEALPPAITRFVLDPTVKLPSVNGVDGADAGGDRVTVVPLMLQVQSDPATAAVQAMAPMPDEIDALVVGGVGLGGSGVGYVRPEVM